MTDAEWYSARRIRELTEERDALREALRLIDHDRALPHDEDVKLMRGIARDALAPREPQRGLMSVTPATVDDPAAMNMPLAKSREPQPPAPIHIDCMKFTGMEEANRQLNEGLKPGHTPVQFDQPPAPQMSYAEARAQVFKQMRELDERLAAERRAEAPAPPPATDLDEITHEEVESFHALAEQASAEMNAQPAAGGGGDTERLDWIFDNALSIKLRVGGKEFHWGYGSKGCFDIGCEGSYMSPRECIDAARLRGERDGD